jgi:SAM-dependent methyltransferase
VTSFGELMTAGLSAPVAGWDFSWLNARSETTRLPWSYRDEVSSRTVTAAALLDMGTGGGEWLSALTPRPARTVATECWAPNVPVAGRRLQPLGVAVVQAAGAPDNMAADRGGPDDGSLPFRDAAFGTVINRHEAFDAGEVARVLAPGGRFVTQQVDYHSDDDLLRLLGIAVPEQPDSWLPLAERQVVAAGLTIAAARRAVETQLFADVSAVVYYLRIVSWIIDGQHPEAFRPQLRQAHDQASWPLPVRRPHFLLAAAKPG